MNSSAIDAGASAALADPTRRDRGAASLKSEDFFRMLVTELQHQDPLEPTKTADMIGQVSQIRSIELSRQLGDSLDAIAKTQRTAGASDLLGKYVTAVVRDDDGGEHTTEGVVTGVNFADDGSAVLELDSGDHVQLADVKQVTTIDAAQRLTSGAPAASKGKAAAAKADRPWDLGAWLRQQLRL